MVKKNLKMRTKSFKAYLEKRLSKEEIAEIEEKARIEVEILKKLIHQKQH